MLQQLRNRWVQAGAFAVVGVALGAAVSFLVFDGGDTSAGGRLVFATGSSSAAGRGQPGQSASTFVGAPDVHLPVTVAEAIAGGWKEAAMCAPGWGRYFHRDTTAETDSHLLMYDGDDQLIGLYLYSMSEIPAPWHRMDQLLVGGGAALLDFEHWGLFVYGKDPIGACSEDADAGG